MQATTLENVCNAAIVGSWRQSPFSKVISEATADKAQPPDCHAPLQEMLCSILAPGVQDESRRCAAVAATQLVDVYFCLHLNCLWLATPAYDATLLYKQTEKLADVVQKLHAPLALSRTSESFKNELSELTAGWLPWATPRQST